MEALKINETLEINTVDKRPIPERMDLNVENLWIIFNEWKAQEQVYKAKLSQFKLEQEVMHAQHMATQWNEVD